MGKNRLATIKSILKPFPYPLTIPSSGMGGVPLVKDALQESEAPVSAVQALKTSHIWSGGSS